eukprot:4158821-Lingulodinium_polyedra.AAC.1
MAKLRKALCCIAHNRFPQVVRDGIVGARAVVRSEVGKGPANVGVAASPGHGSLMPRQSAEDWRAYFFHN